MYDNKQIWRTCEGKTFEFHCYTTNRRDGYTEHATMCDPFTQDLYRGKNKIYNRPWQSFDYQTACESAINSAIEEEREGLRWGWMNAHGYQRMTAKRREAFEASEASTSERLRALLTLAWTMADRVPHFGDPRIGYREVSIIEDLANVTHEEATPDHDVYRLFDSVGNSFAWDQATHTVVG